MSRRKWHCCYVGETRTDHKAYKKREVEERFLTRCEDTTGTCTPPIRAGNIESPPRARRAYVGLFSEEVSRACDGARYSRLFHPRRSRIALCMQYSRAYPSRLCYCLQVFHYGPARQRFLSRREAGGTQAFLSISGTFVRDAAGYIHGPTRRNCIDMSMNVMKNMPTLSPMRRSA